MTEAVLPVEPAQTDDGAVMVQSGASLTVTSFWQVLLQPFSSVTVTCKVTVAIEYAVGLQVIELVPWPESMEPLSIDQV